MEAQRINLIMKNIDYLQRDKKGNIHYKFNSKPKPRPEIQPNQQPEIRPPGEPEIDTPKGPRIEPTEPDIKPRTPLPEIKPNRESSEFCIF